MARKASSVSRGYWLFKSEPDVYSIGDLQQEPAQTTCWDGVRNYQARNFLRDQVRLGDRVFFYHSNADPMAIVGTVEVVRTAYSDHTAFDPESPHYDPKSRPEEPTWYMVDVRLIQVFPEPVTREMLRANSATADMLVLQRGSRLSIQPVTAAQWKVVHKLAGVREA